ncbi:MAG: helix-turn-helix domain-containing protein [Ktedonobacterales bacterium]
MNDDQRLLTPQEIATNERVHPDLIKRALRSGDLHGHKVGRRWRIAPDQYADWLARGAPTPKRDKAVIE